MSHEEVTAGAYCTSKWAAALPPLQLDCDPLKQRFSSPSVPHPCQKLHVSPSLPPGYSSTCSSAVLWGTAPAGQSNTQELCRAAATAPAGSGLSTECSQVFSMKGGVTHTSQLESGTQRLASQMFYSLEVMEGKSCLVSFRFLLSWLYWKVF